MKTIHLIRHAKSSWDFPSLPDHQRPLSSRGEKDAAIMSIELFKSGFKWPKTMCSPAQRAQSTLKALIDNWPDDVSQPFDWQTDDRLYTFSSADIWTYVRELDDDKNAVCLVGHNPALTDFINSATDGDLDNLPTCAYGRLDFVVQNWAAVQSVSGQFTAFLKPKMFK